MKISSADERDHHEHHRRERIEHPAEFEHAGGTVGELQPGEIENLLRAFACRQVCSA